ncbi:MAG TPA: beta-eliminating lyase-related protein [Chryseolinea sp.]|nr:beta-eliminating lyase-related protein [Chryseolinea sp.]
MIAESTSTTGRRSFLRSLSTLPVLLPGASLADVSYSTEGPEKPPFVNFVSDGLYFSPEEYVQKLDAIHKAKPIKGDRYGNGGTTKELEEAFVKLTGKEKAIFFPTGTMANQVVIKVLNGDNTKIVVPENSHIYRDEADAAQQVHHQRLIPAGTGKAYFTLSDLKETIAYYDQGEVFKSGLGTVVIESPVRRADGIAVPMDTINDITTYCKEKGYKTHLDGARIHIASAFTGVSVAAFAAPFDTVYISLYKYLNALNGAMLCGPADVIDKMSHQIKIMGGTTYQTWGASAMALHYLEGIEERWKQVSQVTARLITELNTIRGITITPIQQGTNIYNLKTDPSIDFKKLGAVLYDEHNLGVGGMNAEGMSKFQVNDSILRRKPEELLAAWKQSVKQATVK